MVCIPHFGGRLCVLEFEGPMGLDDINFHTRHQISRSIMVFLYTVAEDV